MSKNAGQNLEAVLSENLSLIKQNPKFDPKREKELDDLYNQYIPPHSIESRVHLLDAAERDAYIDPFPPIGSQKMAGVFVKKAIRKSIGWYIQFIAQQISTFGAAVSQALRSMNHDIEQIKKRSGVSKDVKYHSSLELDSNYSGDLKDFVKKSFEDTKGVVVISDGIDNSLIGELNSDIHPVIVDSRINYCSNYDATVDTRVKDVADYLETTEDATLDAVVLHGRVLFGESVSRINVIENVFRTLKIDGQLFIIVPQDINPATDIYLQLSGSNSWSVETWKHILETNFSLVEIDNQSITTVSIVTAKKQYTA